MCNPLLQYSLILPDTAEQVLQLYVKKYYHIPGKRVYLELCGRDVLPLETMDRKRQSITTSRTFPGMHTTVDELIPHVANYAARCALKLRKQKSVCGMLTTFARTNPMREDMPQYTGYATHIFSTPSANTGEVVEAALEMLRQLYRPGYHYKKAGVIVDHITSASAVQPDLFEFDPDRRSRLDAVASVMDRINARMGNDTLILASQQYTDIKMDANRGEEGKGKPIRFSDAIMRRFKSPDYSTSLDSFEVK